MVAQLLRMPGSKVLGCGETVCYLSRVGGQLIQPALAVDSGSYGRKLDDMSSARVTVNVGESDPICNRILSTLEPFEYELVIYRDHEVAWVGPILEPLYKRNQVELPARDLFMWWERRTCPNDLFLVSMDLSDIASTIMTESLAPDPSPNIAFTVSPTGITGSRTILAVHSRRAADELRELSRTGLDFTTIARTIHFGGRVIATKPLGILTGDYFDIEDGVKLQGLNKATKVTVLGATPSGLTTPVRGQAGGVGLGGLVERVFQEPGILDPESAQAAADTRLQMLKTAPIDMTGRLTAEAPFAFSDLIPGALTDVRLNLGGRDFIGDMRVHDVDVDFRSGAQGVEETVKLKLIPVGSGEDE